MKSEIHALNSVKRWGGVIEDYLPIHQFIDSSKSALADIRHRLVLHNTMGPWIAERIFGFPERQLQALASKFNWSPEEILAIRELIWFSKTNNCPTFKNQDNHSVSVRDVAEKHILEDIGRIPTLQDCVEGLRPENFIKRI